MKHQSYSQSQAIESRRARLVQENLQMCLELTALRAVSAIGGAGSVSTQESNLHARYRRSNMQLFPHQFTRDELKAAGMSSDSYWNI